MLNPYHILIYSLFHNFICTLIGMNPTILVKNFPKTILENTFKIYVGFKMLQIILVMES